jgi:predicted RNase H-like nuclease (RuvC/YqgF family)
MNSPGWEKLVEELEAKIAALKSSNSQMFAELNRQELEIQDLRARLEMYRDHSVQAIANKRIAELESENERLKSAIESIQTTVGWSNLVEFEASQEQTK